MKAWMVTKTYQEWLCDWDKKLQRQDRHILMLQDNFSAHIKPDGLTNICVENFKANLTTHYNPPEAPYNDFFWNRKPMIFETMT
jgi:hypothetical protein